MIRMVKLDSKARCCAYSPSGALIAIGLGAGDGGKKDGAFRVALLTPGPVSDGGWNASAYEGLQRIAKELGASGIEVLPLEQRIRILAMWEQAEAVAKSVLADSALDAKQRVARIYLKVLNREPAPAEVDNALSYQASFRQRFPKMGEADGWQSLTRILLASNEFIYVD